jgi:hypothetical protein
MTPATRTRRVCFEHGQRLMACNLDDAVAAELTSGARHIVGAHSTWGIALGLEVKLRGGRVLEIARGVAYDAWGRTLVVPAPVRLPTPPDDVIVVARWCAGAAAVRALAPADVCPGRDVPLASLTRGASGLDPGVRRFAHTRASARIGAGSFTTNLTFTDGSMRVIEIDTRGAGFVETPSYAVGAVGDVGFPPHFGPLISIADPNPDGFKAQVRYVPRPGDIAIGPSVDVRVDWLGVEPRGVCTLPALMTSSPFTNLERGPA